MAIPTVSLSEEAYHEINVILTSSLANNQSCGLTLQSTQREHWILKMSLIIQVQAASSSFAYLWE